MEQKVLFDNGASGDPDLVVLGSSLFLEITRGAKPRALLYRQKALIKDVDLSDKVAKRLFIVEAVELGAMRSQFCVGVRF